MIDRNLAWKILNRQMSELHFVARMLRDKQRNNKITDSENAELERLDRVRIPAARKKRADFEKEILGEMHIGSRGLEIGIDDTLDI